MALDIDRRLDLARYVNDDLRPRLHSAGVKIGLVTNMPLALTPLHELERRGGNTGDCGVSGILGFLGSGEIALCGIGRTVPELVYGRLGQDSIRDIWLNHPTLLALRQGLEDIDCYPGICGDCALAKKCRTGCVAQNFVDSRQLVWPDALCTDAEQRGSFPTTRRRSRQ